MNLIDETLLRQGAHNWYRNTNWSGEIEVAFLQKLRRARKQWHQYLVIQMNHLRQRHPDATLRLADYYLARKADDEGGFSYGRVMQLSALAYERLGQLEKATNANLEAMKWQVLTPGHQIGIENDFATFAARHRLTQYYEQILSALNPGLLEGMEFGGALFKGFAATAVFENDFGDKARAVTSADQALQCLHSDRGTDLGQSTPAQSVPPELLERLHSISAHMRPAKEHLH